MRALRFPPALAGVSVALPPATALLPEECACCAQPATHRVALARRSGVSLLVGYCEECAEHQASASSRGLALGLASVLLGLVCAVGLPLLAPRLGFFWLLLCVGAMSLLPLLFLLAPRPAVTHPHSAFGPAVSWRGERLACTAEGYGKRVAELNGAVFRPEQLREQIGSAWLSVGPVLGLGAACLSYFAYHPLLRIINLESSRIEVVLDGSPLVSVDPTSNESPTAGALLRVPAGHHVISFSSASDGAPLGRLEVDFQSGAVHLFAAGAEQSTCFWLETTGYGQEQRALPSYQPLLSADHFWTLPGGIDTWFEPNSGATDPGSHSSGGLLTAIRQAPCADAPPDVRQAQ